MSGQWVIRPGAIGGLPHERDMWCVNHGCRPLVLIDPEDRKQVERLADALIDVMCKADPEWDKARAYEVRSHMQIALREFANPTPPKPDEPPPWSVVIVAENTPFTRVAVEHITAPYQACWFGEHPKTGERVRLIWAELLALGDVRIVGRGISEGASDV